MGLTPLDARQVGDVAGAVVPEAGAVGFDMAVPGSERAAIIVSGVSDSDALRALIHQAGLEIDLICIADISDKREFVIRDILPPLEVRSVKGYRPRPAHERIAAQKRK